MAFYRFSRIRRLGWGGLAALLSLLGGCGYTLQGSHSELVDREGVQRIYVKPIQNNTYKPGVENLVYNALIRVLASHRSVSLVNRPSEADALLVGTIGQAANAVSASVPVESLQPTGLAQANGYTGIAIASEYMATLACEFKLERRVTPPGKAKNLWHGIFRRSKAYPGSNRVGPLGTTSALINDSEFDRTLSDLAENMMADVHESMLSMF